MRSLVVGLALAALCWAEPEADAAGHAFYHKYYNLYNPYALPLAHLNYGLYSPYYVAAAPAVVAPAAVVPQIRPYTPRDCASPQGCAALTLKDHRLAKREAEAKPEADAAADPEADTFYAYAYGNPNHRHHYYYNPYNYFYARPYAPYLSPYHRAPYYIPNPVVTVAPVVPAPAPAVVVKPVPVVAATVVKTAAVVEAVKPVTYTHLGAHPVNPTSVLEKTQHLVEQHHVLSK